MDQPLADGPRRAKKKRLRYFVNTHFQLQMVLPVLLFAAAFVASALIFVFLPIYNRLAADPSPAVRALLEAQADEIELRLLPALGFAGFVAAGYALWLSHRAAGPLYRLARALERMNEGTYAPVRFRRGDFFRELETLLNQVSSKMQKLSVRNRDVLVETDKVLRQWIERLGREAVRKRDLQESLERVCGQIHKALERSRIPG